MLNRCTCKCMVSIININIGIKESTHGYQNYNTIQTLIFGGYVKVRGSLYIHVIGWVNPFQTILILGSFRLSVKVLAWYIDPNGIKNIDVINHPYPTNKEKNKSEIRIIDTRMVSQKRWCQINIGWEFKGWHLEERNLLIGGVLLGHACLSGFTLHSSFQIDSIFHWPCNA